MEPMTPFLVPAGEASETLIEKKSRFIGHIWPVASEEEAIERIKQTRQTYWDATHNVYAYVLRGGAVRYSDDGEPGGTAGMPVLNVLQQEEIFNVCCVVTRYFGGTLLGAGGLVRAYGKAAKLALDSAGRCIQQVWDVLQIPCPYGLYERVRQEIAAAGGQIDQADFAVEVDIRAMLPQEKTEGFLERLRDVSNGKVQATVLESQYRAFPVEK